MKTVNQTFKPTHYLCLGLSICTITTLLVACGDDDESTDSKTNSKQDSMIESTGSRADIEASLIQRRDALKVKVGDLETQMDKESNPAAAERRLDRVKDYFSDADRQVRELSKNANSEWIAQKNKAIASLDRAEEKIAAALDREKLSREVKEKIDKLQAKIEELKEESKDLKAEAKIEVDHKRRVLEQKASELQADYDRFQKSTEEKWETFKEKFSEAFKDIGSAFKGIFE